MDRIRTVLVALTLTAVAGGGLTACSDGDDDSGSGMTTSPSGSVTMTTTSSVPVPGPDMLPVEIPAPVADRWRQLGGERGSLGHPTGPATPVAGGSVTDFEKGSIVLTPEGKPFVVQGEILTAYRAAGGPAGELGFPTADEATTDGGWISTFQHGTITFIDGVPSVEVR